VVDPQLGIAVDVFPGEDGHAQERSLLSAVANTIQARDVWILAFAHFFIIKKLFFRPDFLKFKYHF
jgi:hypothetical protein